MRETLQLVSSDFADQGVDECSVDPENGSNAVLLEQLEGGFAAGSIDRYIVSDAPTVRPLVKELGGRLIPGREQAATNQDEAVRREVRDRERLAETTGKPTDQMRLFVPSDFDRVPTLADVNSMGIDRQSGDLARAGGKLWFVQRPAPHHSEANKQESGRRPQGSSPNPAGPASPGSGDQPFRHLRFRLHHKGPPQQVALLSVGSDAPSLCGSFGQIGSDCAPTYSVETIVDEGLNVDLGHVFDGPGHITLPKGRLVHSEQVARVAPRSRVHEASCASFEPYGPKRRRGS